MISIRKLAPLAMALGMAFAASAARADVGTTFNLKDGTNTIVAGASSLDWNEQGSGVVIGTGPFRDDVLLPPGTPFGFLYQANLAAVNGGVPNAAILGLDTTSDGVAQSFQSYEFTIVAKMQEYVKSSGVDSAGNNTATFGLGGTNSTNKVAIYYDTAHNADTAAGTGFDDGTLIALLTITQSGTDSSFKTTPGSGSGLGSAKLHAEIVESGDFIDQNYLQGVSSLLFGLNYQSTLNYPAGTSTTAGFHIGGDSRFPDYVPNAATDFELKVDGSNTFTRVPEPASMLLLGAGLMGLGATRRRAKKA